MIFNRQVKTQTTSDFQLFTALCLLVHLLYFYSVVSKFNSVLKMFSLVSLVVSNSGHFRPKRLYSSENNVLPYLTLLILILASLPILKLRGPGGSVVEHLAQSPKGQPWPNQPWFPKIQRSNDNQCSYADTDKLIY